MLYLKGSHGTSRKRAEKIKSEGFRLSDGRVGEGIYFWCESPYSERLAEAWFKYYRSINKYGGDEKASAVLLVEISVNEDEFLDLTLREYKNQLAVIAIHNDIRFSDKKKARAIYTMFIKRLEAKAGTRFKVLEAEVSTPPKMFCDFYAIELIGSPHCYVVLEKDCVTIKNCK